MNDTRYGLDKVFYTISPSPMQEWPFDEQAFKDYRPRAIRIKTPQYKAWGLAWNWRNDDDHNLIEETIAISGGRTMLVRANLMRLYMLEKGLVCPDNSFDDNICPADYHFKPEEFLTLLERTIKKTSEEYYEIYKEVFRDEPPHDISVRIHQVEVVGEKMNATVFDIQDYLISQARAKCITKLHYDSGTLYFNPLIGTSQVKFYQKNPSILRQEITLNGEDAKDLSDDIHDLRVLKTITDRVLDRFNMGWFGEMTCSIKLEQRITAWAAFLNLDPAILKHLLDITSWEGRKANRNLTYTLVRRKLIKKIRKGKYAPTYYLQEIRKLILQDP